MKKVFIFYLLISFASAIHFKFLYYAALNNAIHFSNKILDKMEQNQCSQDLRNLMKDFKLKKERALKMADASYKPRSGLLRGNVGDNSDLYECLKIVNGKYCRVQVSPAYERNITIFYIAKFGSHGMLQDIDWKSPIVLEKGRTLFGLCVPASCNVADLQNIAAYAEDFMELPLHFEFRDEFCEDMNISQFERKHFFGFIFFGIVGLLILLSTIYDVLHLAGEKNKLYVTFSAYTNLKFLITPANSRNPLKMLGGLKAISIMWVVLGHSFQEYASKKPSANTIEALKAREELKYSFIIGGQMSVDTFLTITGFMIVHIYLNRIKYNIIEFYMHRIFRLTPSLLAIVIFYSCFLNKMGHGPDWFRLRKAEVTCNKYWWSTLIYISNIWNNEEICVSQTWYLSVDMQIYLFAPLIFLNIRKHTRRTLFSIYATIIASSLYAFYLTNKHGLGFRLSDFNLEFLTYIYTVPYMRVTPWLVGMLSAYYLFHCIRSKYRLKNIFIVAAWIVTFITMALIMVVHTIVPYNNSVYSSAFFHALARPAWGACIGWIIFACYEGYGGIVNTVLSHNIFTILSRLTYCIYLTHFAIINISIYQRRQPIYLSLHLLIFDFWGILVFSFLASIILHLGFEAPLLNFESIFKDRYEAMKKKSNNTV